MAEEQAVAASEPDPAPVEAQVAPEAGDYQHFQFWHFFHSPVGIGFAAIAGFNLATALAGLALKPEAVTFWAFFVPLIFLFMVGSMYLGMRRTFAATPLLREPKTYRIDAEGLALASPSLTFRSAWRELHRVAETKKAFFFYIAPNQAHILPKRALADPAVAARLRELARTYGPRKRR